MWKWLSFAIQSSVRTFFLIFRHWSCRGLLLDAMRILDNIYSMSKKFKRMICCQFTTVTRLCGSDLLPQNYGEQTAVRNFKEVGANQFPRHTEKKELQDQIFSLFNSWRQKHSILDKSLVKGSVQRKLRPMLLLLYIILKLFSRRWTAEH